MLNTMTQIFLYFHLLILSSQTKSKRSENYVFTSDYTFTPEQALTQLGVCTSKPKPSQHETMMLIRLSAYVITTFSNWGGFFSPTPSELLHSGWFSSHLTFNEQNILGVCPNLELLHSPIEWDYLSIQQLEKTVGKRNLHANHRAALPLPWL